MSVKPTKPMTAYFRFLSDIKANKYADQMNENTKPQDLWNELPKDVIDNYISQAKQDYDKYKFELDQWYKANPQDYQNDQIQQKQKKQKRQLQQNIDKKLHKYLDNPIEIVYYVSNLMKFNTPMKSSPKVKTLLQSYFQKLDEEYLDQLERAWNSLEIHQQLAVFQWYADWLSKKNTKQNDDQE